MSKAPSQKPASPRPGAVEKMAARLPAKPPRGGRGNGEAVKAHILAVAIVEFATYGFAGARVERVTATAQINDRMLYYYFGSKEQLFIAALEKVYSDLREYEQGLDLTGLPPVEGVRALLRGIWQYYQSHPEFIALVANENMHFAEHLRKSSQTDHLALPIVGVLAAFLDKGAREGVFRPGIDPVTFYITLAGFNYFYLSNQHTLSAVLDRDLMSRRHRDEWLEHMESFIFRFLLRDASRVDHILAGAPVPAAASRRIRELSA